MTKLDQLTSLLSSHDLSAKKKFGQNFLVDEQALQTIFEAGEVNSDDSVVEIGPGTGFLTEKLLERAKRVVAVELDADMIKILDDRFNGVENLNIVHSDALNFRNRESGIGNQQYKVIANIPYYITSPLIKHFLQSDCPPTVMVLLVQKEVAEKVCGITGKSLITIETQLFGQPEIIATVPAKSFYPSPKVDSAILKIDVFDEPLVPVEQLKVFLRVVKFGFSQKRKKLSNSLSAGLHIKPAELKPFLSEAGVDPEGRAEDLGIEDWKRLADVLTNNELLVK